jgi:hypothetical protein
MKLVDKLLCLFGLLLLFSFRVWRMTHRWRTMNGSTNKK